MTDADFVFSDSKGNRYLVRDVLGAGDCALLALLHNPDFHAPVSGPDELRRAVVTFARGEFRQCCSTVYSLVGEKNGITFDSYLSQVLQPGFWVGTVFFIWVTMCYGIGVCSHYFNGERIPECSSTDDFLRRHLPAVAWANSQQQVHVLFHQYRNIKSCKPAMYNHFASLIPVPHFSGAVQTLNDEVEMLVKPWWEKVGGVNGYDCSKDVKAKKEKSKLSKIERKELNEARTLHYLKHSDQGTKLAAAMKQKLEEAPDKDLDVGVAAPNCVMVSTDTQMARSRSVTDTYDRRNWLQRAAIIFIYLHPKIGAKNTADTAAFTGVKESTLLGWMYQKRFIMGWLELVEAMDAGTALRALPANVQDLFPHVDPMSTVCVKRYRERIHGIRHQRKILFKGGKVSFFFLFYFS
jgi:hypothetical protein